MFAVLISVLDIPWAVNSNKNILRGRHLVYQPSLRLFKVQLDEFKTIPAVRDPGDQFPFSSLTITTPISILLP